MDFAHMGLLKAQGARIFGSATCPTAYILRTKADMDATYKRWVDAISKDPREGAAVILRELFGTKEARKRMEEFDKEEGIYHEDEPPRKQPRPEDLIEIDLVYLFIE